MYYCDLIYIYWDGYFGLFIGQKCVFMLPEFILQTDLYLSGWRIVLGIPMSNGKWKWSWFDYIIRLNKIWLTTIGPNLYLRSLKVTMNVLTKRRLITEKQRGCHNGRKGWQTVKNVLGKVMTRRKLTSWTVMLTNIFWACWIIHICVR